MSNELLQIKPESIVKQMEGQWAKVLPRICTAERFARVVLSAINKNPTMIEALAHPTGKTSLLSAFMKCAEMGLEPDGRRAAVVAFKNRKTGGFDITLIPMYQGLSELAMRSGSISYIHADKVCWEDEFDWNLGRIMVHKPNFKANRGEAYLFYCHVVFKDGSTKDELMSKDEIENIMRRSSAYIGATKYGKDCPWTTDFDEMAKKTVFRRCSKWLPLSPELRNAEEVDNADFESSLKNVTPTQSKFEQPTIIAQNNIQIEEVQNENIVTEDWLVQALGNAPVSVAEVRDYAQKNHMGDDELKNNLPSVIDNILNGGMML